MKTFSLIISLLCIFPVLAHENCGEPNLPELDDLLMIRQKIEWEAATAKEIQNANCLRKNPFTLSEMNDWMSKNQSAKKFSKTINGINFKDESPENLDAFFYLTTTLDFANRPDPKSKRSFKSVCTKVDCALKEIFGPTVGVQLKFMQQKFGMNGSHLVEKGTSIWTKPELDTILLALSDFPDGIFPVEKSRPIVHATRGLKNGDTMANAIINIFDLWNQQSPEIARSTIVHELGHVIAFQSGIHSSPEWLNKAGWVSKVKVKGGAKPESKPTKPETIVSRYGMSNEWEDFAESVVAYRYNPELLKAKSPAKYQMVRQTVFDNVEYTSKAACQSPHRLTQTATKSIAAWEPSVSEIREISLKCNSLLIKNLSSVGSVNLNNPAMIECYRKAIKVKTINLAKKELSNNPNYKFMGPMLRNLDPKLPLIKETAIISKIQDLHRKNIRGQLVKAMNYEYFCNLKEYAYQQFNNKELGFDSYNQTKDFQAIAAKLCPKMKTKKSDALAAELIK